MAVRTRTLTAADRDAFLAQVYDDVAMMLGILDSENTPNGDDRRVRIVSNMAFAQLQQFCHRKFIRSQYAHRWALPKSHRFRLPEAPVARLRVVERGTIPTVLEETAYRLEGDELVLVYYGDSEAFVYGDQEAHASHQIAVEYNGGVDTALDLPGLAEGIIVQAMALHHRGSIVGLGSVQSPGNLGTLSMESAAAQGASTGGGIVRDAIDAVSTLTYEGPALPC